MSLHLAWSWLSVVILHIMSAHYKVAHAVLVRPAVVDLLVIVCLDVWWCPLVLPSLSPILSGRIGRNIFALLPLCSHFKSCNLNILVLNQLLHLLVACRPRLRLRLPLDVLDAHSISLSIQNDILRIQKAQLIAWFVKDFLTFLHRSFCILLYKFLILLDWFVLKLVIFCFIHLHLILSLVLILVKLLLLLVLLASLDLIVAWRSICSLYYHILAEALLRAQNSLVPRLHWNHGLL